MNILNINIFYIIITSTIIISNNKLLINNNNIYSFPKYKININKKKTSKFSTNNQSPTNNIKKKIIIKNNYNYSINTTSLFNLLNINTNYKLISFKYLSTI